MVVGRHRAGRPSSSTALFITYGFNFPKFYRVVDFSKGMAELLEQQQDLGPRRDGKVGATNKSLHDQRYYKDRVCDAPKKIETVSAPKKIGSVQLLCVLNQEPKSVLLNESLREDINS